MKVLRSPIKAIEFAQETIQQYSTYKDDEGDNGRDMLERLNILDQRLQTVFQYAQKQCLPELPLKPKKPWTSLSSLEFISQRLRARQENDFAREKELNHIVKKSIANDKATFLKTLAGTGTWRSVKDIRKPRQVQQGRLRDLNGSLVDSDQRAATLAEYLEKVQWAIRPANFVPEQPPIGQLL